MNSSRSQVPTPPASLRNWVTVDVDVLVEPPPPPPREMRWSLFGKTETRRSIRRGQDYATYMRGWRAGLNAWRLAAGQTDIPPVPCDTHEAELSILITERDYWEGRATELAQRVGQHFCFDVGEHSSMNCPVLNALESKWAQPGTQVPEGAMALIAAERRRQIEVEGWTAEHDDAHDPGELAAAASAYALNAACQLSPHDGLPVETPPYCWPWAPSWWKPATPHRDLEKAGALIAAELDRQKRAASQEKQDD